MNEDIGIPGLKRVIEENVNTQIESTRGLGDVVHAVALPIARALHLSCVDPATKKLRPESPCAARRKKMNEVLPFKSR